MVRPFHRYGGNLSLYQRRRRECHRAFQWRRLRHKGHEGSGGGSFAAARDARVARDAAAARDATAAAAAAAETAAVAPQVAQNAPGAVVDLEQT